MPTLENIFKTVERKKKSLVIIKKFLPVVINIFFLSFLLCFSFKSSVPNSPTRSRPSLLPDQ